jgi:hypothetical protein
MATDPTDHEPAPDIRVLRHRSADDRTHFFVDEAGNFDFSGRTGASRYFILTSVTTKNCHQAEALLDLRRQLVWDGHPLTDAFHATEDKQAVRNRVFALLAEMSVRVDATIFDKRVSGPGQRGMLEFYRAAWRAHAARVIPLACPSSNDLLVVAASIGTRNEQKAIGLAITEVVRETGRPDSQTKVAYWPAWSDPCLQVTDYCCWAIQRKWERGDNRSYALIEHLIDSEELGAIL